MSFEWNNSLLFVVQNTKVEYSAKKYGANRVYSEIFVFSVKVAKLCYLAIIWFDRNKIEHKWIANCIRK